MYAGTQLCFDLIDKAGTGKITAETLFMFTSNVLNEEQNAPLFESVLTTQYSIHLDDSQSVPVEFVLELSDCDAFVNLFDRNGKGWISLDDLMVALMPHSLSLIK